MYGVVGWMLGLVTRCGYVLSLGDVEISIQVDAVLDVWRCGVDARAG